MKVSEIMKTDVYSVKPDDPLTKVASIICGKKVSGVSVVNDDGELVGIISEKDLLRAMYPSYEEFHEYPIHQMDFEKMEERYEDISKKKVEECMTKNVITVPPDTPILKLASLMIRQRIRRVPIVDGGKLVGIVSQGDIHQAIFRRECSL